MHVLVSLPLTWALGMNWLCGTPFCPLQKTFSVEGMKVERTALCFQIFKTFYSQTLIFRDISSCHESIMQHESRIMKFCFQEHDKGQWYGESVIIFPKCIVTSRPLGILLKFQSLYLVPKYSIELEPPYTPGCLFLTFKFFLKNQICKTIPP